MSKPQSHSDQRRSVGADPSPWKSVFISGCSLRFVTLITCGVLLITINFAIAGRAQTSANHSGRFNPSGDYHPVNPPAGESERFIQFDLQVRRKNGKLIAWGEVRGVERWYKFTSVTVSEKHLKFSTVTIKGVRYSFDGEFLGKGDFASQSVGNGLVMLEGVLRKLVNGQSVSETRTSFLYFAGC